MEGGFPYGDVIVIGAIAAFILLRYRAMLGTPRGRDENAVQKPMSLNELERVIQLPANRLNAVEKKEDDFGDSYGSLAETFTAMRAIDREFLPDEFLGGARIAYEMVLTAYSKRDRDTLQGLLSDAMYKEFSQSLEESEKENRFTDTTLVAITKATIKDAVLRGSKATLTIEFVSDQILLIRDENGNVVEGNASQQDRVEDEWVFTRDMKSTSPNWTIIET